MCCAVTGVLLSASVDRPVRSGVAHVQGCNSIDAELVAQCQSSVSSCRDQPEPSRLLPTVVAGVARLVAAAAQATYPGGIPSWVTVSGVTVRVRPLA